MKIAFVWKGGSGKTTLTASYAEWLIHKKWIADILIIDADHNAHIKENLQEKSIHLHNFSWEKSYQKSQGAIRTSLPNSPKDLVYFSEAIKGIQLLEIGKLSEVREWSGCYHGQINDIEIFLNYLIDREDDRIISDMTAWTDIFGSSYFAKFDILIWVCEPTEESINVIQDISARAKKYNIPFYFIANKYYDDSDIGYIEKNLWREKLIWKIPHQRVRSVKDITIPEILLNEIDNIVKSHKKNWNIFEENLRVLHEKNRNSWAKEAKVQSNFSYWDTVSNLGIR
jgi:CO dehydrogenase maturation factor